jgi:hypothetical protein
MDDPILPPKGAGPASDRLQWHRCHRRPGHGVASGRATHGPYPEGSIALQRPHFTRLGLDLGACFNGTLNLAFPGGEWRFSEPAYRVEQLLWTDLHPPETFSFWPCLLRCPGLAEPLGGWIYRPHPETKQRHHQPPDQLEVLMLWIDDLAELEQRPPGLELGVDGRRCRLIQPARLKARLLEFLKFRVLAAQDGFFAGLEGEQGAAALRSWLASVGCREELQLSDADLLLTLAAARRLYVN